MKQKLLKQTVLAVASLISTASFANAASSLTPPPTDVTPPNAPTGLVVSNPYFSSGLLYTADLVWNVPSDNVGVVAYQVLVNGSFAGSPDVIWTPSGYTWVSAFSSSVSQLYIGGIPVNSNGFFNIRVKAVDAAGNVSAASNVVQIDGQAPSTPSLLPATQVGLNSFGLNWSGASDNAGVTGYKIYKNGTLYTTVSGNTLSTVVNGLTPGTQYNMTVKAFDAAGNYSNANTITVTTVTDTQNPSTPTNLTATQLGYTGFTLNWSAASDNVGVTAYRIFKNGSLYTTVAANALSTVITGLTPGTQCAMKVKAVDAAGNVSAETASSTTTVTTLTDTQAPVFPAGSGYFYTNVQSSTSVYMVTSAASDNVGVAGYKFYRGNTLIATTVGDARTCTATGLTAGTTYTLSVRAYDAAGNLSAPKSVTVTTPSLHMMTIAEPSTESDLAMDVDVVLSPNPVENVLQISPVEKGGSLPDGTYAIYNSLGATVQQGVVADEIQVNDLHAGTYYIVFSGLNVAAKKFVKQ